MASRPMLSPHSVITNGDMSASIISEVTIIQNMTQIGYDVSWTGSSPVGVCTVQVSNSYSQNAQGGQANAGNWTTVTTSPAANVSGNTGNGFIEIDATGAYAVRLIYTRTSGTGTMQAIICGKVA